MKDCSEYYCIVFDFYLQPRRSHKIFRCAEKEMSSIYIIHVFILCFALFPKHFKNRRRMLPMHFISGNVILITEEDRFIVKLYAMPNNEE
jgi:hypothetical protein